MLYRSGLTDPTPPPEDAPALIRQESIGGRFETGGSFRGTRWQSVAIDRGEEQLDWESTQSAPSDDDVDSMRLVVAEVLRRQPLRR